MTSAPPPGGVRITVEAPAHTHSYEAAVTDPTCTEGGYTTYTCECGDSYVADETAALGHTEEIIPGKAPTCTETGLTEGKKCSVCGEITAQQEVVDALGHDFAEGTCTHCGEPVCTDHDWDGLVCRSCGAVRENPFTDVEETDFYFLPVLWAVDEGVTSGATATTFNPGGDLLRAQVVTMLWRHAGSPVVQIDNPFTDVKEGDWYYNAVLWAVSEGITNGTSSITFGPAGVTNRAQVVTLVSVCWLLPILSGAAIYALLALTGLERPTLPGLAGACVCGLLLLLGKRKWIYPGVLALLVLSLLLLRGRFLPVVQWYGADLHRRKRQGSSVTGSIR